ncbi:hypothetical protein F7725_024734 [Dissostichus mawsoni]|uniref:E2F/DP family winged-helix DNA-binding domain-containing protein n=1 Tax=Dissostichus mawsoni TaxID=36200 RepID=A0A7J5X949_DISMA|nr:hypothetical protein F7725_024734 [Dissostichus mawsoni]
MGLLTRRFADIMRRSHDGVVDLNFVAHELNAPKRRLYDVTNVLEGIKLIKKKSKNYIEWLGGEVNSAADVELKDLVEQERILDELILSCRRQVHRLYEDQSTQKFAYLTYEDIQQIPSLKEQTVIVIRAPAETKLEVPHPEESLQVHLSSTQVPSRRSSALKTPSLWGPRELLSLLHKRKDLLPLRALFTFRPGVFQRQR